MPVSGWSDLGRSHLAQSLMLSAGIHAAVLAMVHPRLDAHAPASVVINARLQTLPARPAAPVPANTTAVKPLPGAEKPPLAPVTNAPPQAPVPPPAKVVATAAPVPQLPDKFAPPISAPPAAPQSEPVPETPSASPPRPTEATADTLAATAAPSGIPFAIAPAVDTTWYRSREVDSPPTAIGKITPRYPESARRGGQEGKLKLMVRIDDLGRVQEVEVLEAQPQGVFEESALEAFRSARFRPAMKNGRPVRYQAYIRVEFKLE